jgi:ParB family chromosome partitioning protein
MVPIEDLHRNRSQPRARFDEDGLAELAASIGEMGMLEPIVARQRSAGGYEIIAGERRWRAAQRAGLYEVPVFVMELNDERAFLAALVENLQRQDLTPLETARAYQRLVDGGRTVEAVAKTVGKHGSSVSNTLRLLKLPHAVLELIDSRQLSEGHGRALLGARSEEVIAQLAVDAVEHGWSVRETERRAKGSVSPASKPAKSANVRDLERRLTQKLHAAVEVDGRPTGGGQVTIRFTDLDQLDHLLHLLELK